MKKQLLSISIISCMFFSTNALAQTSIEKKILNDNGTPSLITFKKNNNLKGSNALLQEVLNLPSQVKIKLDKKTTDKSGQFTSEKFQFYYNDIIIEGAVYNLHYKNNTLTSMNGNIFNTSDVNPNAKINSITALSNAIKFVGAKKYMWEDKAYTNITGYNKPTGELVLLPVPTADNNYKLILAYKFDIYASLPLSRSYIYVNAEDGKILSADARVKHSHNINFPKNTIKKPSVISIPNISQKTPTLVIGNVDTRYSGQKQIETTLVGTDYILKDETRGNGVITKNLKKSETISDAVEFKDNDNQWTDTEHNNATFDNAALDAHWGAEKTYDYFKNTFNRNSYDDAGATLYSYVHYGNNVDNAYWTGSEMLYGDGQSLFNPLTSFDITAHELGHAVTEYTSNLKYERESGALNEGFSDIWSAIVENKYAPEKQPWIIGEDITKVSPGYLRSLVNPKSGLSAQPDTYRGLNWKPATVEEGCVQPDGFTNDYCGVHYNSGVINHWFYILVEGKTGTNDKGHAYSVTGIGWEKAEQIVYKLQTTYLTNLSNYKNTRDFGIQVAKELYGEHTPEAIATQDAFYAVGIGAKYLSTPDTTPPTPPVNLQASNIGKTAATLTWEPAIDTNGIENYIIYNQTTEVARTNSNVLTYTLNSLTPNTQYTYSVKAIDPYENISQESNLVNFKTLDGLTYCTSRGQNSSDEKIQRVQFNTIDNQSTGTEGYEDFSGISTTLERKKTYPISITPVWTNTKYNEGYKVFIDWNGDGDFTDANETALTITPTQTTPAIGTITVPETAVLNKNVGMRVSMKYNNSPTNACETFQYGQVEDYTLNFSLNLSTNDATKANSISIYPNPAKDVINIKNKDGKDLSFRILDLTGKMIITGKSVDKKINISTIPVGNYILETIANDGTKDVQKFIKK